MRLALGIACACLTSGALATLYAAPGAAQINRPPALNPARPALNTGRPPNPPSLVAPAEGHVINAVSGVPSQIFSWDPPAGGAPVTFYRMTFENADNPRAYIGAQIRVEARAGRVSAQQIIPPPLANARIRWSVRSCNDEPAMTLAGAEPGNCGQPASRILSWSTGVQPPRLSSPAAGGFSLPNTQFTWSTVTGANAYLFCLSRPGVACPTSEVNNANTIVIRRVGNSNTAAAPDTTRFLGQTMNWTAAACGGSGQCVYQQSVRAVTIGGAPPVLASPANGASTRSIVRFDWAAASGADYYVLCVSAPGVACPNPAQFTEAQVMQGSGRRLVIDNPSRPAPQASTSRTHLYGSAETGLFADLRPLEGAHNWTVAACVRSGGGYQSRPRSCVYQQSVRAITTQPRWDVSAHVTPIQAHDNCDEISDGDWNMSLFIAAPSDEDGARWPSNTGSRDVGDDQVLDTSVLHDFLRVHATGLGDNETATVTLVGVDCDSNNLWDLSSAWSGVGGVVDIVRDWSVVCGGEEVYEVTFENDFLGEVNHAVRLADHRAAGRFTENVSIRSGRSDCSSQAGAYTATMTISGERR